MKASSSWSLSLVAWFVTPACMAISLALLPGLAIGKDQVETRIDDLLSRMTLQEKLGQLQQLDSVPEVWRIRDEHRDLISRGLVGSFLNIRGAKSIN